MPNKKRKHSIKFTQPSMTRQSEKELCNVNNIMAKYEKTGLIDHFRNRPGEYGDFTNVQTYQDALNKIMLAENQFNALPADLRKRFDNDPVAFVEYVTNPENHESLAKMGLLEPIAPEAPAKAAGEAEKENPTPTPKEDKKSD